MAVHGSRAEVRESGGGRGDGIGAGDGDVMWQH